MHFYHLLILPNTGGDLSTVVTKMMTKAKRHCHCDWWQVGGRWTGALTDYDPTKDPKNIELCTQCNGTGMRMDLIGQNARAKNPDYKCNGCEGKGKRAQWPTEWKPYQGDIQVIKDVEWTDARIPHSFQTPDGRYYESEFMAKGKALDAWQKQFRDILKLFPTSQIVVIDYHN